MARTHPQIETSDTFQTWLQRTNALITELETSILTASTTPGGDLTVGNVRLEGSFEATDIAAASASIKSIDSGDAGPIEASSTILTTDILPLDMSNAAGPKMRIRTPNISWSVGVRGASSSATDTEFTVGVTGSGGYGLRVRADGTVFVNALSIGPSNLAPVAATRLINTAGGITGGNDLNNDLTLELTGTTRSLHNLAGNGMLVKNGASVNATSIEGTAGGGITVSNGAGSSTSAPIGITVDSTVLRTNAATQTIAGSLTVTGSVSAANLYSTSDVRLKDDIEPIQAATDLVRMIDARKFKMNGKTRYGVIAQQIETVLPELVGEDDGGFKNVMYIDLISILLKAVQEQDARIAELEKSR
jgi:hypothetical protein